MRDQDKTKAQLIDELAQLRQRLAECEKSQFERVYVGKLEETTRFYKNLTASMRDGFSVLDTDGVHIDVNHALCEMTGFSRDELIGVGPPHPYWPSEAYDEIERAFQFTLRGDFRDFELIFIS